jgi:hypothetical protein
MAVNFDKMSVSKVRAEPPAMTPEKVFEVVELINALGGKAQFLAACHAHGFALRVPAADIAFVKQAVLDVARVNSARAQPFSAGVKAIVKSYPTCT